MIKSSDYQDLKVWQKAMDLAEEVYTLVKYLPVKKMVMYTVPT